MKKKLLLLAFAPALFSCSNDDNASTPTTPELRLVTSSNTSGKVSYTDLMETTPTVKSFAIGSLDTDGVFYDSERDEILLASRSNNKIEVYNGVKNAVATNATALSLSLASASEFNNPREVAVSGDKVVVTQDQNAVNGNTNKLLVYQRSANSLTLLNSYTVNFKTWGIAIDGTTLYAIADLTGDLVVFENFFANTNGSIMPTKRVTIQGLVRTHGIAFSKADNRMVLTDVGAAASDSDGGLIIINNFSSVLGMTSNGGTIATANQVRVYGPMSTMGNPVDVAYDEGTDKIYVAERLNMGGRLLTFTLPTMSGDAAPAAARAEAGISSVHLHRK
ncbi:MAG: hypothetical protein RLZZ500_563 [Bacteroidota bacterium]|jgi:hypothetical protein